MNNMDLVRVVLYQLAVDGTKSDKLRKTAARVRDREVRALTPRQRRQLRRAVEGLWLSTRPV